MPHLYLSSCSAINCNYSTESGQVLYKVTTPPANFAETRRTLVRRAVETSNGVWLGDKPKDADSDEGISGSRCQVMVTATRSRSSSQRSCSSESNLQYEGHFAHLAHIEYSVFKSSSILYAGQEKRADKFFRAKGWSWYGLGRHKVFRASDGKEYRWVIGSRNPKLVRNDGSNMIVARFHRARDGIGSLRKTQRPSLEISSEGEHIQDEILITFVFLREAEEK